MRKQIILLFHIGYWSFYLALLLLVFVASQVGHSIPPRLEYFLGVGFSFVLLPSILGFYFSYHFLFTEYLRRRKVLNLLIYSFLGILLIAIISAIVTSLIFTKDFMFKSGYESFIGEMLLIAIIGLVNGTIGFVLKGFISWYADLKIKEKLQQQTHSMKLEMIKSKLDPHFLFNTINNIDGLLIKDVSLASKYLVKLSTILRFMLYESKVEKIALTKELEYIQKYIDLQKIRTTNPDFVNYQVSGPHFNHQIPPMLFIPFIENAFKHVASKKSFHAIEVKISIEKEKIVLQCKNNFDPKHKPSDKHVGIGNELIKKRLNILYPNQHLIEKSTTGNIYSIQLTIQTREN